MKFIMYTVTTNIVSITVTTVPPRHSCHHLYRYFCQITFATMFTKIFQPLPSPSLHCWHLGCHHCSYIILIMPLPPSISCLHQLPIPIVLLCVSALWRPTLKPSLPWVQSSSMNIWVIPGVFSSLTQEILLLYALPNLVWSPVVPKRVTGKRETSRLLVSVPTT